MSARRFLTVCVLCPIVAQGRNPLSCLAGAIALTIHVYRKTYVGVTTTDIATLLGIADNTVRKAHRDVIERVSQVLTPKTIRRFRLSGSIIKTLTETSLSHDNVTQCIKTSATG